MNKQIMLKEKGYVKNGKNHLKAFIRRIHGSAVSILFLGIVKTQDNCIVIERK